MQKRRIKLTNTIQLLFIVSLILLTVVIVILQLTRSRQEFNQRANTMRTDYVAEQKALIKHEMERLVSNINRERLLAKQQTQEMVQQHTQEAHAIALNIYQQNKNTKTAAEIQKMIKDALRPIRFNRGSGYYFATRLDGVEVLFADKPELEGSNLLNLQNSQGQYVIRDMIAIAKKSGEGFYEYQWTKPAATGDHYKKIAFIKLFKPYSFFIGTGLYVDDIESQIKAKLLRQITAARFGKNGYFFVSDWKGISLAHGAQPSLVGVNLWDATDSKGNKTSQNLVAIAKFEGSGYLEYWWKKPDTKKESPKIAFTQGIPEWEWMIGTGVYIDDVETSIAVFQSTLSRELRSDITKTILAAALTVLLFLAIFQVFSRRLLSDFSLLVTFFEQAATGDKEIDCSQMRFEELYQMASNANVLLSDKKEIKQNLWEEKERFRDMAEQLPVAIFETDITLKLTYVNRYTLELFGYSRADLSNNLNGFDMFIPEEKEILRENIARRMMGEEVGAYEYHAVKKDGSIFPVLSHNNLIQKDGKGVGVRGVLVDITEQKQAEEEQLKLKKLESVGVLAGGIAHDFNNLLAGLFGNFEMAKRFLSKEHKSYKYLEGAGQAMGNATNLTQQLLTFAKGGDPIKETLPIGEILSEAARFSLRGSNTKLQTDIDPDLRSIDADKGQICQVISNLVINAQEAMSTGGNVNIRAKNINTPTGQKVQISIRDEGAGISPQDLEKIFDPYFTTKQHGSGLGLASSYSIIKKHKGNITVKSVLNKGTKFTIELPAVTATTKTAPQEALEETTETTTERHTAARILVMDDEETIRTISGAMLEEMGHQVFYAVNGQEALEKYSHAMKSNAPYDIVISDLTIPGGMGGQEVAQKILKLDPQANLIVSSGYATDPVMARYKEYGFKGRVSKPYYFAELEKVIQQIFGRED